MKQNSGENSAGFGKGVMGYDSLGDIADPLTED